MVSTYFLQSMDQPGMVANPSLILSDYGSSLSGRYYCYYIPGTRYMLCLRVVARVKSGTTVLLYSK